MKVLITFLIIGVISFIYIGSLHAETLELLKTVTISKQNASFLDSTELPIAVYGCSDKDDTIIVSTDAGLLYKTHNTSNWSELIDYKSEKNPNYGVLYSQIRSGNSEYYPGYLVKRHGQNGIEIVQWLSLTPYDYELNSGRAIMTKGYKIEDNYTHLDAIGLSDNLVAFGINSEEHDHVISLANSDYSKYSRIFELPSDTKVIFDSIGTPPECRPAIDPSNKCIWFVYSYFNKIYKINLDGDLLDSIEIDAQDFCTPQPPLSRLKTNAVFQDWLSKTTPIMKFAYIHPGYLIIQYPQYKWAPGQKTVAVTGFSTRFWHTDKTPVDIPIDKNWILIQAQPNGTMFFTDRNLQEANKQETMIYIVRIKQ